MNYYWWLLITLLSIRLLLPEVSSVLVIIELSYEKFPSSFKVLKLSCCSYYNIEDDVKLDYSLLILKPWIFSWIQLYSIRNQNEKLKCRLTLTGPELCPRSWLSSLDSSRHSEIIHKIIKRGRRAPDSNR